MASWNSFIFSGASILARVRTWLLTVLFVLPVFGCKDVPGTSGGGSPEWRLYNTGTSGVVSDTIFAVFTNVQGEKWFGTDIGLSRLLNQIWTRYDTLNSGLRSN